MYEIRLEQMRRSNNYRQTVLVRLAQHSAIDDSMTIAERAP